MACQTCGATNPAGAKFCVECGSPQRLPGLRRLGAGTPVGVEMTALARPILEAVGARPYLEKLSALEAQAIAEQAR
jgi:hypothetical protein